MSRETRANLNGVDLSALIARDIDGPGFNGLFNRGSPITCRPLINHGVDELDGLLSYGP